MRLALATFVLVALAAPAALADSSPPRQGVTAATGGPLGRSLYAANCASCHGSRGEGVPRERPGAGGVPGEGPPLTNVGALAADFYVRTGYMPLEDPRAAPSRSRVLFPEQEIRALVGYVASFGHGPPIPTPQWRTASVSAGLKLFTDHCAGCHQIVARGGVVTGARVPPLEEATPRQVAQAIRIGPYLMPRFSPKQITPTQVNDIVAYVQWTKNPDNRGGLSLGNLGPWPEGMVTWLFAAALLVAVCTLFARRARA